MAVGINVATIRADMGSPMLCARADVIYVFNATLMMGICFDMTRDDLMLTRDDMRGVDIRANVSISFKMKV